MNHRVTHAQQAVKMIRERLDSREWWVWIPIGHTGAKALQKIEKKFYWNEANKDFDLTFFPQRLLFVALGKKSRATPKQLRKLLRTTERVNITIDTDVMILVVDDDELGKSTALSRFAELIYSQFPDLN